MDNVDKKWRVLYTKSRHEKTVVEYLTNKGIINYLPTYSTLKQWSDRKKKVEEVLFKSYVFVNTDDIQYFDALRIPGVVKYVSFGGKTAVISDRQIEIIRSTIENKIEFDIYPGYFAPGKLVTIKSGPLKGVCGEIVLYSGSKKLLLRIDEVGYSLLVKLNPKYILGSN
jgi:transcriptional antiterminator RfaH